MHGWRQHTLVLCVSLCGLSVGSVLLLCVSASMLVGCHTVMVSEVTVLLWPTVNSSGLWGKLCSLDQPPLCDPFD